MQDPGARLMAAIHLPLPRWHRRALRIPAPSLRLNRWILAAIAVVALSAMLPVLQNSAATSRGFQLQTFEAEKTKLNGQIRLLEADVAQLSSLPRVQRRASELGLEPGFDPIYVTVGEAGPVPAKIPAEYLPGPARKTDVPEPWWRSLLSWVALPD